MSPALQLAAIVLGSLAFGYDWSGCNCDREYSVYAAQSGWEYTTSWQSFVGVIERRREAVDCLDVHLPIQLFDHG
jgi:hypothetical protein